MTREKLKKEHPNQNNRVSLFKKDQPAKRNIRKQIVLQIGAKEKQKQKTFISFFRKCDFVLEEDVFNH